MASAMSSLLAIKSFKAASTLACAAGSDANSASKAAFKSLMKVATEGAIPFVFSTSATNASTSTAINPPSLFCFFQSFVALHQLRGKVVDLLLRHLVFVDPVAQLLYQVYYIADILVDPADYLGHVAAKLAVYVLEVVVRHYSSLASMTGFFLLFF